MMYIYMMYSYMLYIYMIYSCLRGDRIQFDRRTPFIPR